MSRERLDTRVAALGLCPSREKARAEILAGNVLVDGLPAAKPGQPVSDTAEITLRGPGLRYVGRGGLKLEKALAAFDLSPADLVCLDCGASSGGFTDCLLQNGARKVYAVDVGVGQLDPKLRADPRVVNMEKTNIRSLGPGALPEPPTLAVIDVSFISLTLVLPPVAALLAEGGTVLCLIKPQFEAGREHVGKNGVVRDPAAQQASLDRVLAAARALGFSVTGLTWSPVRGQEGNLEYLARLDRTGADLPVDTAALVAESHKELC